MYVICLILHYIYTAPIHIDIYRYSPNREQHTNIGIASIRYVCVYAGQEGESKTLSKALDGITPLIVATLNGSLEVGLGEYT